MEDQWLEDHTSLLTNYYISIMQVNERERDGEEGKDKEVREGLGNGREGRGGGGAHH